MPYFDHAATTEPWPELIQHWQTHIHNAWPNPASAHQSGQRQARRRDDALRRLAVSLDCDPRELVATSSATEATNQVFFSVSEKRHRQGRRILVGQGDHDATLQPARWLAGRGFEVVELPLTPEGAVDLASLRQELSDDVILLSTIYVNNETGAISDLESIRTILAARAPNCLWHVDAVQAWTKTATRLSLSRLGADYVSLSGHKIHGPRGSGLLYARDGAPLLPLIMGGGQQQGRRSGTEDPLTLELLAMAAEISIEKQSQAYIHTRSLRRRLLAAISELEVVEHGQGEEGLPSILSFSLPSARGETMATALSHEGFEISTGSACGSSRRRKNHVLAAMGLRGNLVDNALRVSFDCTNTEAEVDALALAIGSCYERVRYR
ncbi:MAG: cysteine desulfurase family protein [Bacillota bacterium]|nr:cysteine desulfurase family protein [Bacillota bacterium]